MAIPDATSRTEPGDGSLGQAVGNARRLAALRRTGLLDTPPEESFDRLTRVASAVLDAPVAMVTLVDEDRQFFKSCVGLTPPWDRTREIPLSHSFCRHAVEAGEPLVVSDAREHPLLSDNPAVESMGAIAYCGIPLESPGGHMLGTLCVLDHEPRSWSEEEVELLQDLAGAARTEIELRLEVDEHQRDLRVLEQNRRRLERVVETTIDGIVLVDADGTITYANPAAERILSLEASEIEGKSHRAPDWEVRRVGGDPIDADQLPVDRVLAAGESVRGQELEVRVGGNGEWRVVSVNAAPIVDDGEIREVVATFRDVTRKKRTEEELRHRALHDTLTGLPNRSLFFDRLEHALSRSEREGRDCAVLFLDLDGFKAVNDRYGHAEGDEVLAEIARRMVGRLRDADSVARIGGDEFTVLLEDPGDRGEIRDVTARLMEAVVRPLQTSAGEPIALGASVGVASCRAGGQELGETVEERADELVRRADQAMYRAKERMDADGSGGPGTGWFFYGDEI